MIALYFVLACAGLGAIGGVIVSEFVVRRILNVEMRNDGIGGA